MPYHTGYKKLYSYSHQEDQSADAEGCDNNICYLCLACLFRQTCRCSTIITICLFTVCFLFGMLIYSINQKNYIERDYFRMQKNLNQKRYLDGQWANVSPPFICVDFQGRLGNELFEYAALYVIAKGHNLTPLVPGSLELWNIFSISAVPMHKARSSRQISWRIIKEKLPCAYDSQVENLDRTHTRLTGYYQSWKYFKMHETALRKELTLSDYLLQKGVKFVLTSLNSRNLTTSTQKVQKIASHLPDTNYNVNLFVNKTNNTLNSVTLVGIHVRQGDMVHEKIMVEYGYLSPEMSYFDKATDYYRKKYKNVLFIVCTDGIQWVKANMHYEDMIISENNSKEVDMTILSLCDHTIISVGSFGWWSAWLTNGEVTYFNGWPKFNSTLYHEVVKEDYFLPQWIPIE